MERERIKIRGNEKDKDKNSGTTRPQFAFSIVELFSAVYVLSMPR